MSGKRLAMVLLPNSDASGFEEKGGERISGAKPWKFTGPCLIDKGWPNMSYERATYNKLQVLGSCKTRCMQILQIDVVSIITLYIIKKLEKPIHNVNQHSLKQEQDQPNSRSCTIKAKELHVVHEHCIATPNRSFGNVPLLICSLI